MRVWTYQPLPGIESVSYESADAYLLPAIENDSRTWEGFLAPHYRWPQNGKPVYVYEHGWLSSQTLAYRVIMNRLPAIPIAHVFTWGEYSRARLLEVGWPGDRVTAAGSLLLPSVLQGGGSTKEKVIAYLPCHDPIIENEMYLDWLLTVAKQREFSVIAKVRPGAYAMPCVDSVDDWAQIANVSVVVSPIPQTAACAALQAGFSVVMGKPKPQLYWPGYQFLTRGFTSPIFDYKLSWFDSEVALIDKLDMALSGYRWPDESKFLVDTCGVGIAEDTLKCVLESHHG